MIWLWDTGATNIKSTQILTAAFDIFNEFEMNATCYQVRSPTLAERAVPG